MNLTEWLNGRTLRVRCLTCLHPVYHPAIIEGGTLWKAGLLDLKTLHRYLVEEQGYPYSYHSLCRHVKECLSGHRPSQARGVDATTTPQPRGPTGGGQARGGILKKGTGARRRTSKEGS